MFEGPFSESFDPSDETEQLLVQASQILEGLEPDATNRADRAAVSGTIDDLLLKDSQQLEHSSEESVQQAGTQEMLVGVPQLLEGLEPDNRRN